MDCGWQNLEQASNYSECLKSLASNVGYVGRAASTQTSGMRDALSPFAMMVSLQLPSEVLPSLIVDYTFAAGGYAVCFSPSRSDLGSIRPTSSSNVQTWCVSPASIAGVTRNV